MESEFLVRRDRISADRIGAIVTVIGPDGSESRGRVMSVDGDWACVRLFERLSLPTESPLRIDLIQALPKKEKMAFIIQKATELGVSSIHPCVSARSTRTGETEAVQDKSHRWSEIARKAVDQCRRRSVPVVLATVGFEEAITHLSGNGGLRLLLYEKEHSRRLKKVLSGAERPGSVALACGPEGGFTEAEVHGAEEKGFVPVSLGGRIMRCETAALAALAIVQYEWGDL